MSLKFQELTVPVRLKQSHRRNGGEWVRRFTARATDAKIVRVMAGMEPAGKNDSMIRHVSVSVARSHDINEEPCRVPTDAEFEAAAALIFNSGEWEEEPKPSKTGIRHAWDKQG